MARMESLRKNTDASTPQGMRGCWGWQQQGMMRHTRIATLATSRVVSVGVLLMLRLLLLLSLVFGGIWLAWRLSSRGARFDGEPPPLLCLPDWSYAVTTLYFLMAAMACLRQSTAGSSGISALAEDSASSTAVASAATLFALEISIVFQTIVVPVTWIEHAKYGKRPERAVMSTLAFGAVLTDLLLNRSRIEAKHSWILLVFLLAWAVEQVAWVHSGGEHLACYQAFDARGMGSLLSAAIAVVVVVSLLFAYAALCAQRDRLTSRLADSLDPDYTGPDVEEDVGQEDVGQEAVVTRQLSLPPTTLRAPPISERACVVNPIFAGSGSRMQRQWPNGTANPNANVSCENRASLASIETEMSSGEDLEPGWPPPPDVQQQADPNAASGAGGGGGGGGGGRHSRGSSLVAPMAESGGGPRRDRGGSGSGRGLTAHPSSWAGYGGAAAWVRSSRDVTPSTKGGKGGARRGPSRF